MITKGKWEVPAIKKYLHEPEVSIGIHTHEGMMLLSAVGLPHKGEMFDNANFIVSACNACKEINPDHPELVAQNIKDMYEALNHLSLVCRDVSYTHAALVQAYDVLSKIKGGE